jgi:L-asparaginase
MQNIVILGTGGTIAGQAARADDSVGYRAGTLGVQALIDAVPPLRGWPLETEQVASLDSKDMDAATWQRLAQRAAHHLARPEVRGVVVTHGTDTLEETAWFLHRVLAPARPLVLTAAMRPASALSADGPQNLLDAVILAAEAGAAGVMAVLAGEVQGAAELRKRHTLRQEAFRGGDAGPLALVADGRVQQRPGHLALGGGVVQSRGCRRPRGARPGGRRRARPGGRRHRQRHPGRAAGGGPAGRPRGRRGGSALQPLR